MRRGWKVPMPVQRPIYYSHHSHRQSNRMLCHKSSMFRSFGMKISSARSFQANEKSYCGSFLSFRPAVRPRAGGLYVEKLTYSNDSLFCVSVCLWPYPHSINHIQINSKHKHRTRVHSPSNVFVSAVGCFSCCCRCCCCCYRVEFADAWLSIHVMNLQIFFKLYGTQNIHAEWTRTKRKN